MKAIHTISIIAVFLAATASMAAQNYPEEYLGLPGDNLNLYAVMNLFQESETLEGFEKSLNDQESMINNLDLNGDNLIDYISVSDYVEGNVHSIVLRAALNRTEQQDIAVFVVEQLRNGEVQIQLIGDEALYGRNYIVEPIYAETPNPGYTGQVYARNANVVSTTYYDIATWPMIRYIYHPRYRVWRSSWYWGYYPSYWRPWRAHYWHYYYGYHSHWHDHYYSYYRPWHRHRCGHYNTFYHSNVRVYSPTVVVNINNNRYRTTYSRPDRRNAGEQYYASDARTRTKLDRSARVSNRQSVTRNATPNARTRSNVETTRRSNNAVRSTSTPRSTNRSATVRNSQRTTKSAVRSSSQRSNTSRNAPAVKRSGSNRSSAVRSTPASRSTNRSATVKSSQQTNRSAVRSSSQRSSAPRKAPAVQRSSSSRKSTPSVQRSSSSRSSSSRSSAVQRSQPSKSRSAVQRSSSSSRKSSPSVQRSQSSSRKSSAVQRRAAAAERALLRSSVPKAGVAAVKANLFSALNPAKARVQPSAAVPAGKAVVAKGAAVLLADKSFTAIKQDPQSESGWGFFMVSEAA